MHSSVARCLYPQYTTTTPPLRTLHQPFYASVETVGVRSVFLIELIIRCPRADAPPTSLGGWTCVAAKAESTGRPACPFQNKHERCGQSARWLQLALRCRSRAYLRGQRETRYRSQPPERAMHASKCTLRNVSKYLPHFEDCS